MLTNSTLSGNSVSHDGGGLYAQGGHIQLSNTTIAGNHIVVPIGTFYAGMGGGVYITATAVITAQNTILAGNTRRFHIDPPVPDDCLAIVKSLHSLGYNLIGTTDNCLISGTIFGNITGQDPLLGPLQFNGGTTQTQLPLPGSPAIDHGDDLNCPLTDQRGFGRIQGEHCDIGAVEANPDLALKAGVTPAEASPGGTVRFTLVFSNSGSLPASGVVITDSLPAQIQPTGVLSSGVAITNTGLTQPFVWQVQDLDYAQGGVITITGVVRSDVASGLITNTATIATSPADPNPLNDQAQAVLKVSEKVYLPLVERP